MATTHTEMGINRTGIGLSPKLAAEMVEGTREFPPSSAGDEREVASVRAAYAAEGELIGSVPPPPTMKGMVKTAVQGISGARPAQFIDKLGERLAFERTGVRIYEALLSKFELDGSFAGGPSREELVHILTEEYEHFRLLERAITKVGGDPTVMTPSADFHGTMSIGILGAVTDPRTPFAQCLEAAIVIELADNECWDALVELAQQADEVELVEQFQKANANEAEHLLNVRKWLAAAQDRFVDPTIDTSV